MSLYSAGNNCQNSHQESKIGRNEQVCAYQKSYIRSRQNITTRWLWSVTGPASDHVRLLGVVTSADLSLDRHVSVVSSASFYWLRRLRRIGSHTGSRLRYVQGRLLQSAVGRCTKGTNFSADFYVSENFQRKFANFVAPPTDGTSTYI